jgi:hypothetical protein
MSQEAHTATAIFTTISGVIGGVTKAFNAKPIYLAANNGKVLYCAIEEGFGYTLKEKIKRLKADHPNLFLTDRVPENQAITNLFLLILFLKLAWTLPK